MSEKCQTLVAEGDAIQQNPVAQQHELLVSEIESTDGHLGTALRCVDLLNSLLSPKSTVTTVRFISAYTVHNTLVEASCYTLKLVLTLCQHGLQGSWTVCR